MDSDSSVDRVDLDGKTYRLKCDICKSKRTETEFDFHPCKVEKCTFSICWSCLQRWKDQSDKDVTKRFECPQCHTEYDTQFIEEHKPLSAEMINKVNVKAKLIRKKKKKLKKKREQEKLANKAELDAKLEKQNYLRQRRLDKNNKNKKKKEGNNNKNDQNNKNKKSSNNNNNRNNQNGSSSSWKPLDNNLDNNKVTNVLNKHRIIISFNNNVILKQKWNDKMISDIFGKIGPIANIRKTDYDLTIDFKKAQSDKARRVLLYLFDLPLIIADDTIKRNSKQQPNPNDIFNPSAPGGKREFLKQRDLKSNWNEYSIPSYGNIVPPGCKRWINQNVTKLTKDIFVKTMQQRQKIKQQQRQSNGNLNNLNNMNNNTNTSNSNQASFNSLRPPPISNRNNQQSYDNKNKKVNNNNSDLFSSPSRFNNNNNNGNNNNIKPPSNPPIFSHHPHSATLNANAPTRPPRSPQMEQSSYSMTDLSDIQPGSIQHSSSLGNLPNNGNRRENNNNNRNLSHHRNDEQWTGLPRSNSFNNSNHHLGTSISPPSIKPSSYMMGPAPPGMAANNNITSIPPPIERSSSTGATSPYSHRPKPLSSSHEYQRSNDDNLYGNRNNNGNSFISSKFGSKSDKIANILGFKRRDKSLSNSNSHKSSNNNSPILKWQKKQQQQSPKSKEMSAVEIAAMIRWKCNNIVKVINIISDDDDCIMSDDDDDDEDATVVSETATTATSTGFNHSIGDVLINDISKQQSQQSSVNGNAINILSSGLDNTTQSTTNTNDVDADYDGEYDYSDSEEDYQVQNGPHQNGPQLRILRPPVHQIEESKRKMQMEQQQQQQSSKQRQSPPRTPPRNGEQINDIDEEKKENVEDMTIQEMLENLDHLEGDQIDTILTKLLDKNDGQGNNINNDNNNNNKLSAYDYDEDESHDNDMNYVSHPNPKQFTTHPLTKEPDADLHIFAKSMGYNKSHGTFQNDYDQNSYNHSNNNNNHYHQNNNNNDNYNSSNNGSPQRMVILALQRHERAMKEIAIKHRKFNLSSLPDLFFQYQHKNIKSVYSGKLKDLVMYFKEYFDVKHNYNNNQTVIFSKKYQQYDLLENNYNDNNNNRDKSPGSRSNSSNNQKSPPHHAMNGLSLLKSAKKRFQNKSDKKSQLRWTPKKKDKEKEKEENNANHNRQNNDDDDIVYNNDFRYGPSDMYTVPRAVPTSHSHIIGQTAAVGTANSYNHNNRFGTTNARPYLSARKGGGYNGTGSKVKTYGDYEDELPHTPSGSEGSDV